VSDAGQKAMKTQMNADVAQMNVPHGISNVRLCGATGANIQQDLLYVHLRCICVHLRFQSLSHP
jgi:hypothetical protein